MGAVYRGWDIRLEGAVAIKEMVPPPELDEAELQQMREQFRQEAVMLRRLNHANLVRVIDFFEEAGNTYLVMDFVEGENLADRIRHAGKIPEAVVLTWAEQLLDALAHCHNNNILHRDIKPQNVIIRPTGQAVLVDFGLVKMWNPNAPQTKTLMRGMGTPEYAPPEQYDARYGHTDPRSDIYSFGATLYHALTGDAPPSASTRIADPEMFERAWQKLKGVSERTCRAIQKSLELPRTQRWPNVGAMAEALGLKITYLDLDPSAKAATKQSAFWTRKTRKTDQGTIALSGVRGSVSQPYTQRRFRGWGLAILLVALIGLGAGGYFSGVFANVYAAWFPPPMTPSLAPTATSTATYTPAPTQTPDATSTGAAATVIAAAMTIGAPTHTPTSTPSPTNTPRPTRTPRPTMVPRETATPSVTRTLPPTSVTASATPGSTQPTATPRATSPGAIVTFEQMGTWRRGDQPYGELSQTQEQVYGGSYAGKLSYNFPGTGDDFVVFSQPRNLASTPNMFSAWVYGDGSGHFLNLWIQDAQNEIWSVHLGRVGTAGWKQVSGSLVAGKTWPDGHVSGPDNGVVDYPVQFYALVLDRPDRGSLTGQIYIDDISAWRSNEAAVVTPPATTAPGVTVAPTAAPAPAGEVGRIIFTVQTGDTYYLYSTDPNWSTMQEIGQTDKNNSTCAGGATASTLTGITINLYGVNKCGITARTDVCTSPDGRYKVITNQVDDYAHTLSISTADETSQWAYYQGYLNRTIGIQWTPNSQYVIFGVDNIVNIIQAGTDGYKQLTAYVDNTWPAQLSPDSSMLYYLQATGSVGATDVFVVNLDGSGLRNLTNAPIAYKQCPRWRR